MGKGKVGKGEAAESTDVFSRRMRNFSRLSHRIFKDVQACLLHGSSLEDHINQETVPIYLKSTDLRVLSWNDEYLKVFAPDSQPLGRFGDSYLHDTVVPISKASDQMILNGCSCVMFDHYGHDCDGNAMIFQTAKYNLVGVPRSPLAILGITRIEKRIDRGSVEHTKAQQLANQLRQFQSLSAEDRELAIWIAQGKSTTDISSLRHVTKRTIENHRSEVLQKLNLESTLDLVKMLVRLEEHGYEDLGI